MDQVKKIAGILWGQRFWILCGAVTLLPIGAWFATTSSLRKHTEERKTAIDGKVKMAQTLLAKQDHPNDESHKRLDALRVQVTNDVGLAWRMQYEKQKGILVWPKELLNDFLTAVEPLRPVEKVGPPASPTDEILKINLRERYRNYIGNELPKLAEKIGAAWRAVEGVSGEGSGGMMPGAEGVPGGADGLEGMGGGAGTSVRQDTGKHIVVWSSTDQQALRGRYDWSYTPDKAPRTIDVLYAQEDLWVMWALMDIIATTNQNATGHYNAIVKQIDYINLGRDVGGRTGSVMNLAGSAAGMGMGSGMGSGMEMGMGGMMPGMPGMEGTSGGGMDPSANMADMGGAGGSAMPGEGGGTMTGSALDPAAYRYVDQDLNPVSADTLRTAITSESQDPANAFLVVAKRIPVKLGLTVDQRRLNVLIAACANAPLTLEVRQVRFNKQGGSTAGMGGRGGMSGMMSGMGGGMSSMGGMMGPAPGGMGMGMGMGMGLGGGAESGMPGSFGGAEMEGGSGYGVPGGATAGQNQHDKPIEIMGVMYIYNPVDVKKLGIENLEAGEQPVPAAPEAGAAAAAQGDAGAPPAAAG